MTVGNGGAALSSRCPQILLFDLDDTLYRSEEIPRSVRRGIELYMIEHLGIDKDVALQRATELYLQYGTTLAGLVATGSQIDYDKWHESVHYGRIDYQKLLKPDPALRELLCSIDLPKYVLTNADKRHMALCLDRLGISDCFQGVFHFEWLMEQAAKAGLATAEHPVVCKPLKEAYHLVLQHLGVQPQDAMFFDDSSRNVASAHDMGITTVMVGQDKPMPGADYVVPTMHHLPAVLPELIDKPGMVKESARQHVEHSIDVSAAAGVAATAALAGKEGIAVVG